MGFTTHKHSCREGDLEAGVVFLSFDEAYRKVERVQEPLPTGCSLETQKHASGKKLDSSWAELKRLSKILHSLWAAELGC